jgi:hypothetical protein
VPARARPLRRRPRRLAGRSGPAARGAVGPTEVPRCVRRPRRRRAARRCDESNPHHVCPFNMVFLNVPLSMPAMRAIVVGSARLTPRNVNNGRWPRGHPCVRVDDIPCCVCGDAGPCARDSFLLCSDCNVGAHVPCLLTGQKRRCRRGGGGGSEGGAERMPLAVVSPPPPQRDGDDWLCGFCLREGER